MPAGSKTLSALTAAELAERIASGEVTSEAAVQACLDRIADVDDSIRAWAYLDPEHALAEARRRDDWRKAGHDVGPLHGVPVGLKDIFDTGDMPTENGSRAMAGRQPTRDSAVAAALRAAGAVILGKTVTTEFAMFTPGSTANPHNPAHTSGGSSSGSAAAVAAGMVPVAVGSQTAGSVIRPASFCGVAGYKPSSGLISRHGALTLSPPLDTVGTFGRTLADAALLAESLMVYDANDSAMIPRARPALRAAATSDAPVRPMFAFVKSPAWNVVEDDTKDAFAELCDFLGDAVDDVELPGIFDEAAAWQRTLMVADIAKNFEKLCNEKVDTISDAFKALVEEGRDVRAVDYNRARDYQEVLNAGLEQIFSRYDAILTPAAPGTAPAGLDSTGNPACNVLWTYCGVPAVSLPIFAGENGLPFGAQLVGPRLNDGPLLRTARWLQAQIDAEASGNEDAA